MQVSSMQEISTVLAKVMQSDGMDWGSMESVREHVASAFTDLHMIVDICLSVYLSTYVLFEDLQNFQWIEEEPKEDIFWKFYKPMIWLPQK